MKSDRRDERDWEPLAGPWQTVKLVVNSRGYLLGEFSRLGTCTYQVLYVVHQGRMEKLGRLGEVPEPGIQAGPRKPDQTKPKANLAGKKRRTTPHSSPVPPVPPPPAIESHCRAIRSEPSEPPSAIRPSHLRIPDPQPSPPQRWKCPGKTGANGQTMVPLVDFRSGLSHHACMSSSGRTSCDRTNDGHVKRS